MPKKTMKEKTVFSADTAQTAVDKNSALAVLLQGAWADLQIVKIDRIEIGAHGWRATYRE